MYIITSTSIKFNSLCFLWLTNVATSAENERNVAWYWWQLLRLGSRWGSGRVRQNQSAQKVQKTKKSSWFLGKSGTFWWRLLDSNQWPPACEAGALTSWAKPPDKIGDPYETRTRVTAVKGRCLNHLTNGPYMPESIFRCFLAFGSGDWIRTGDTSGMNRMLWPTELRRQIAKEL